ncbi:WhiB family transcriptional regulator [Nakamurella aerolata]|uniref:Transcriptional regulator WhiB n=1 Tax=Nakamurella aerolata TaxID=1656892 RepID=A0A849A2L4_9ACTN|nr:WhiB family transcriptional regulator [Nakamurella aerolata]NNG34849.1 WhiB family transcriptional regulator [Nakamurella aerolata]
MSKNAETSALRVVPTPAVDEAADTGTPLFPTAVDRSWTTRAVCATKDPDLLFVTGAAQREAARLCQGCPVKVECLADALDNQVEFGVWGGLTERQRRAILRKSPDVRSWREVLLAARDNATAATAG